MSRKLKLMSLFDGSGGFPLAGVICGVEPVYASEIEPYPIAVTTSRFPNMKHLGDVSKVHGYDLEPVDIITFGSPCQDLSVAGKRAGLKHEDNGDDETTRSGLFMEAIRIIKEMRGATNGLYPQFALWENVPGAFSSNNGQDFKTVLEEFIRIKYPNATLPEVNNGWPKADCYVADGLSVAYRTFDSQYWGVPQRRSRIYLVADFRGQRASKILFERDGLQRDFKACGEAWKRTSTNTKDRLRTTDSNNRITYGFDPSTERVEETDRVFGIQEGGNDLTINEELTGTLTTGGGKPRQGYPAALVPYTLKIRQGHTGQGGRGPLIQENKSATLSTLQDQTLFQPISSKESYSVENHSQDGRFSISEDDTVQTLTSTMGTGGNNVPYVMESSSINSKACDLFNGTVTGDVTTALTTASARLGTGPSVLESVSYGFDSYNQDISEETATTLKTAQGGDSIPKVLSVGNNLIKEN